MRYIRISTILCICIACILSCSACNNEDSKDSAVTTHISLEAEKSEPEEVTYDEDMTFTCIPNLTNMVIDKLSFNEETGETSESLGTYLFRGSTNGTLFVPSESSYNRYEFSITITEDADLDTEVSTDSETFTEDIHNEVPFDSNRYYEFALPSVHIKFSGDIDEEYRMFVINGNLCLETIDTDYKQTYILKPRMNMDIGRVEADFLRAIQDATITPSKVVNKLSENNAPKELIDFLSKMSTYPCTLKERVHSGNTDYIYTQEILNDYTALVTLTFDDKIKSQALYSMGTIYDINAETKSAVQLIGTQSSSQISAVEDLQMVISEDLDDLVITSDLSFYNDIEYTHVNVTNKKECMVDFYFDKGTEDIRYIVRSNSVLEVLEFNNAQLDESRFKLPSDYEIKTANIQ